MNDLYRASMGAAVDRLEAENELTGVVVTSAKKTFFAGGDLKKMMQAGPDDAPDVFAMVEDIEVAAAPAGDDRPAGRRRHQRRRARRRPGDRAGLPPPDRPGPPEDRARPARGHPRPAARRRRRHPGGPDARPVRRPDGRAAARAPASSPPRRWRRASSTSWSATATSCCRPPRRGSSRTATTRRRTPSRGTDRATGCPAARPSTPEARGVPAGLPGQPAQAAQGRELPGAAGHPVRGRRGRAGRLRHREPHRVALPDEADRRPELQEHDPGVLLRPAGDQLRAACGPRASRCSGRPGSACSAPG